jgi:hypothetical protein
MKSEGPVILAAFANDHSDQARFLRNLSTEAQRIQKVLEPAQELCPLVLLPGAKLEDILDAFQKYRDRIVVFHYAGHANGFQLLLESASGGVHRIGAKGLASFLGQQQGLQLVFLNGCSTERQAEDLLAAGVGCVIATTQAIDDAVATDFSARFYKGIVTGAPLQAAYSEAVGAAQAFSGGSIDRLLVPLEGEEEVPHETGRWPWLLKLRPGAERVAQWSLPEAAGDPLFGLPPVKPRDLPESPYRHLYRFEEQHAEVFFGRGHEIRELYQRVTAPDSPPVVLFYGPAGVGKSSLLDAGLIPRLEGKNEVRYERREPTLGLGNSLRLAFPMEFRKLSRRDAWIEAEKQLGRPLVIVLDQVEEAFTKPNPQQPHELEEFAQLLRRIFFSAENRPQGRLILGFRKEWFAEIDERLADAQVPRSRIFLERLCRDGAIEAITGPVDDPRLASHYKLTVEDGLPEIIADDLLADPDTPVAPTLQILLTRMWSEACRRNREKPTFDAELYQSLHRDGILLDDFLKQQTELIRAQLPRAVDSGFLLDLLEFHTTAIGTSAEHPVSLLEQTYSEQSKSGLLDKALKLCEEAYLLTFSSQPSEDGKVHRSSRLLHDTLAPLIRARHEESDLPGQRARRILDNRVVDWLDGKAGIPLDAKDLKEVEAALEGTRSWSADEQRLVTASREQRSSNRRWSRIFKALGVAAVVTIAVAGSMAYFQWGEAVAQKKVADEKTALANQELATSESRTGLTARDVQYDFLSSAHHFAASAAASVDTSQKASMQFAASRSIVGLELVNAMKCNSKVHKAWLGHEGSIIACWGKDSFSSVSYQTPDGIKTSSPDYGNATGAYFNHQTGRMAFIEPQGNVCFLDFPQGQPVSRSSKDDEKVRATPSSDRLIVSDLLGAKAIEMSTKEESRVTPRFGDHYIPDGVRISSSGNRALTWSNDQPPRLWSHQAPGNWAEITPQNQQWSNCIVSSKHDSELRGLVPEFLADTDQFILWQHRELPREHGNRGLYVTGNLFGADGTLLKSVTHMIMERANGQSSHLKWTHAITPDQSGFLVSLWISQLKQGEFYTMSFPRNAGQSPREILTDTVELSDTDQMINGAEIAGDCRTLVAWSNKDLLLVDFGVDHQPNSSRRIRLPQRIQQAVFSADSRKVLAWTAEEPPLIGSMKSSLGSTPGIVRIWETDTAVPLTAPIRLSMALRGAKFVDEDQGLLLWGDDGMVQHWRITATPTSPGEVIPSPPPPEDGYPRASSADNSRMVVFDSREMEIEVINGKSHVRIPRNQSVMGFKFFEDSLDVLEWGGADGSAGLRPGGYVSLWSLPSQKALTPTLRQLRLVKGAVCNSDRSRILTGTKASPIENTGYATVHLWDTELAAELMEPLVIFGTKECEARFDEAETKIVVQAESGIPRASAYVYDISLEKLTTPIDPRFLIVIRTGTYLNRFGEVTWLPIAKWRDLVHQYRTAQPLPQFEEWRNQAIEDDEAPPPAMPALSGESL